MIELLKEIVRMSVDPLLLDDVGEEWNHDGTLMVWIPKELVEKAEQIVKEIRNDN